MRIAVVAPTVEHAVSVAATLGVVRHAVCMSPQSPLLGYRFDTTIITGGLIPAGSDWMRDLRTRSGRILRLTEIDA